MRYTLPHGLGLRFALLAALAAAFVPITLRAQSQSDTGQSVADAARRSREQKKKSLKPAKSLTDDDLQRQAVAAAAAGGSAAVESAQGQAPATESAPAPAPAEAAGQNAPSDAEVKVLKDQLAQAQKDLDLLQREFALERDQFYSNPQFSRDSQGKAKLDSFEREIRDRQEQAERLKTRLAALQELQARTKGKQPAASEKPASPPQN